MDNHHLVEDIVYNLFCPSVIRPNKVGVLSVNFTNLIQAIKERNPDIPRPDIGSLKRLVSTKKLMVNLGEDYYKVNPEDLVELGVINRGSGKNEIELNTAIHFLIESYPEFYAEVLCTYSELMLKCSTDYSYSLWEDLNSMNKMGKPFNEVLSLKIISMLEKKITPNKGIMHINTLEETDKLILGIKLIRNLLKLNVINKTTDWDTLIDTIDLE